MIEKAIENLNTASHKIAESVYKATTESQATAGAQAVSGGEAGKQEESSDDVIDAEFEVKE